MSACTKTDWFLLGGIVLIAALVLVATNNDYGLTYDEPVYASRAATLVQHWLGLLVQRPATALSRASIDRYWQAKGEEHPSLMKLTVALTSALCAAALPGLGSLRAAANLYFCVALVFVYLYARRLAGRAAGAFAALALLTMPRLFAHGHLVALDVPVTALTLATLYLIWRALERGTWTSAIAAGLVFGLALETKLAAIIILPVFLIVCALQLIGARGGPSTRGPVAPWTRVLVCLVLISPLVFVLLWPWLWYDSLPRLAEYLRFHLRHYPVTTYYFGRTYAYAPWHYPLVYTLITIPPVTLALAFIGALGYTKCRGVPMNRDAPTPVVTSELSQRLGLSLLFVTLALFYLGTMLPKTPKYNGERLILPVFPLWAVLAGLGFDLIRRWLIRRFAHTSFVGAVRQRPLLITSLLAALALVGPARAVAVTHPYQLSYYNILIGNLRGASKVGMEPTYWGDTYLAGWSWLTQNAPPNAKIWIAQQGMLSIFELYRGASERRDLVLTYSEIPARDVDYAVLQNKPSEFNAGCQALLKSGASPDYTLQLGGVPLLYVFDRAGLMAARQAAPAGK